MTAGGRRWEGRRVVVELKEAGDYYLAEKYHQQVGAPCVVLGVSFVFVLCVLSSVASPSPLSLLPPPTPNQHTQYLSKGGRFGTGQSAAKGCNDEIRCYG